MQTDFFWIEKNAFTNVVNFYEYGTVEFSDSTRIGFVSVSLFSRLCLNEDILPPHGERKIVHIPYWLISIREASDFDIQALNRLDRGQ